MRVALDALVVLLFVIFAVMTSPMAAQTTMQQHASHVLASSEPIAASALTKPLVIPPHRFWDRTNTLLFSGVAASRAMDYASTKNMLARGRQEILIPDDVVYSSAGFPALEAAATGTSIGFAYMLHRTGHHTLERWLSIGHIAVTDFGVARNYSLKSRRRE